MVNPDYTQKYKLEAEAIPEPIEVIVNKKGHTVTTSSWPNPRYWREFDEATDPLLPRDIAKEL
jgi:hypothetical protein